MSLLIEKITYVVFECVIEKQSLKPKYQYINHVVARNLECNIIKIYTFFSHFIEVSNFGTLLKLMMKKKKTIKQYRLFYFFYWLLKHFAASTKFLR